MDKVILPQCCPICGYFFSMLPHFEGQRCTEPGHWLAAGRLAPTDYYEMAQLCARDKVELHQSASSVTPPSR